MSEQYPYRTGTSASPGDDTEIACLYGQLDKLVQQRDEAEDEAVELKGELRAANNKIDHLEARVDPRGYGFEYVKREMARLEREARKAKDETSRMRRKLKEEVSRRVHEREEASRKDREAQAATMCMEKEMKELKEKLGDVQMASDAFQRQAEPPSGQSEQEKEHTLGSRGSTVAARGAVKKRRVADLVNLPSRPSKNVKLKTGTHRSSSLNRHSMQEAESQPSEEEMETDGTL